MRQVVIENPVLNSPYDEPGRHFRFDEEGITDEIVEARRVSSYFVPIAQPRKRGRQLVLDTEWTEERIEENKFINRVRERVAIWRKGGYQGITNTTRRLLEHWQRPDRDPNKRLFFCQIEALETAIYITEVARKYGDAWIENTLREANDSANPGLFRIAFKMATGSGKTVVMAMLIAWHVLNKLANPQDDRFTDSFLIVTPGITIKDRLRVLLPEDPAGDYYRRWDIVPPEDLKELNKAKILITNFHAFKPRERGDASRTTKAILNHGQDEESAFRESPDEMVRRVCKTFGSKRNIVVINDEGHHCYRHKPDGEEVRLTGDDREEAKKREEAARIWISGLEAVKRKIGLRVVYDLSATPFFLRGSGYAEGTLFPWVVSDFSLIDAIESGIVKVPRVPVADDSMQGDQPTYRDLWFRIRDELPKKGRGTEAVRGEPHLPAELQSALHSLYGNYEKYYLQLESGEAMTKEFKQIAAREIEEFKAEYRARYPGRDAEKLTDEDLLREVMNTVGKPGKLGEHIKCVVSVSMLTEGWDASTVTHILGVRAFGTQLLCEQVVGRGLRRRTYAASPQTISANGRQVTFDGFEPDYAEVYGVPFSFIPCSGSTPEPRPGPQPTRVRALEDRIALEITFPRLMGYRYDLPGDKLTARFTDDSRLVLSTEQVPTWTENAPIVGESTIHTLDDLKRRRLQEVAFLLAKLTLEKYFRSDGTQKTEREAEHKFDNEVKAWLFPQVLAITRQWMDECLVCKDNTFPQMLLLIERAHDASDRIYQAIVHASEGEKALKPILYPYDTVGSTRYVDFDTTRPTYRTRADRCHVSHVVADTGSWEQKMAQTLEEMEEVICYVKNQNLGFKIPYTLNGEQGNYEPDFIVRIDDGRGRDDPLNLIIEVTGEKKKDKGAKVATARLLWVPAVNNHGGFGRWAFLEIEDPWNAKNAIRALLQDYRGAGAPAPVGRR